MMPAAPLLIIGFAMGLEFAALVLKAKRYRALLVLLGVVALSVYTVAAIRCASMQIYRAPVWISG